MFSNQVKFTLRVVVFSSQNHGAIRKKKTNLKAVTGSEHACVVKLSVCIPKNERISKVNFSIEIN